MLNEQKCLLVYLFQRNSRNQAVICILFLLNSLIFREQTLSKLKHFEQGVKPTGF